MTKLKDDATEQEVFVHFTGELAIMLAGISKDAKSGIVRPEELVFLALMAKGLLGAATELQKDGVFVAHGSADYPLTDDQMDEILMLVKHGMSDGDYTLNGVKYEMDELQMRYAAECRRRGVEPDPALLTPRRAKGGKKKARK